MKKKIVLFFTMILAISLSCSITNPKNITSGETTTNYQLHQKKLKNINNSFDVEGDSKEYLEPCYGDYEIIEQPYVLYSADAKEDQYENNNSFSEATIISNSINNTNDYTFSIYATLHRNEWLWGLIKRDVDEDYFRFDLMGNAKIDISLKNIPENCDYDLDLYVHNNSKYAGKDKDSVSLIKQSRYASNSSERIFIEVGPGTYYLRVYPYNNTFDAANNYNLTGKIAYTSTSASISDMRFNKGAKGAVWVSDYDPFGIAPLSTFGNPEVGVIAYDMSGTSITPMNFEMYNNPYFSYMGKDKRITQAAFYIWDDEWRQQIYDFLTKYEYALANIVKENIKLRASIERKIEIINGISTVTGIILSLVDMSTGASFAYTIFDTLLTEGAALGAQMLHPEAFDTTQFYLLEHVRYLKNSFERTLNPTINEAIKITSSYSIETEEPFGLVQWNYHCNFTPTYDQNGYSTISDTIPVYTNDTVFRGSTYALRNEGDVTTALRKNGQYLSNVNTGGDEELFLDNYSEEAKQLRKGEYHWYHFTAPENGKYNFYSINSMDTYGELFNEIVPARETNGRLAYDDDHGEGRNFSIVYSMLKGQTVYLRISGYFWTAVGNYTPMVTYDSPLEEEIQSIHPAEFGYKNEYVDEIENTSVTLENGFSFKTERYRCGYINKQYLALSAKRNNVDTAWLELDFEKALYSVEFSLGLWSNEEYLNSKNSYILFQYATEDGKWIDAIDFNLDTLSKNKDELDLFSYSFNSDVRKIRFLVHTNQVNYEKNKGRVVIGDITVTCAK